MTLIKYNLYNVKGYGVVADLEARSCRILNNRNYGNKNS